MNPLMKTVYFWNCYLLILILPVTNAFADELTLNIDKTIYEKSDFISVWGSLNLIQLLSP